MQCLAKPPAERPSATALVHVLNGSAEAGDRFAVVAYSRLGALPVGGPVDGHRDRAGAYS
jgi:hypothetical protein